MALTCLGIAFQCGDKDESGWRNIPLASLKGSFANMRNSSRRIGFVSPRQLFRSFVEARFRRDWHSLQSEMMISSSPRLTESRPAHRKSAHRKSAHIESIASNTPSPGTHSHSSRQSCHFRRNRFAYPQMAKAQVTKKVRRAARHNFSSHLVGSANMHKILDDKLLPLCPALEEPSQSK